MNPSPSLQTVADAWDLELMELGERAAWLLYLNNIGCPAVRINIIKDPPQPRLHRVPEPKPVPYYY